MRTSTSTSTFVLTVASLISCGISKPLPVASRQTSTATGVDLKLAPGLFGPAIEGVSVNSKGEFFAADYEGNHDAPSTAFASIDSAIGDKALFVAPNGTVGAPLIAGSRFLKDGRVLLADAVNHKVLAFTPANGDLNTFCTDVKMLQPNDLALSGQRDTLIFLSGQNFTADTTAGVSGDLWTCDGGLAIQFPPSILAAANIHRTNGIETSPCGQYLYLSSAINVNGTVVKNSIFRFKLDVNTGNLLQQAPTLFFDFVDSAATDVDGMRTDIDGNLFVTRNGDGKIVKLSADGKQVLEISLPGMGGPSNLEFGGAEGKTLVAIGKCADDATQGCAASFESDVAGKAFTVLQT